MDMAPPNTPDANAAAAGLLWFTGLPGSGKSAVARAVYEALRRRLGSGSDSGAGVRLLVMDELRKAYFPMPTYTEEEREAAYALFADEAVSLAAAGALVLMDATAHRRAMRDRARKGARQVSRRFAEVHVHCSLETARAREAARPQGRVMADLYAKALERQRTGKEQPGLGQVVGVDVPYEENHEAELVLDSEALSVEAARDRVLAYLENWT